MKLSTFQIINSFGFRDSGVVNLLNSKDNFIYILGRNSSGKSSLLNSINYFGVNNIPSEQKNFQNFNQASEDPKFIANFVFENSKLSFDSFSKRLSDKLSGTNVNESVQDFNPQIEKLVQESNEIYKALISELNRDGEVEIQKLGGGSYHFIQKDFKKYEERRSKITSLIKNSVDAAGIFRADPTTKYKLNLSFSDFEQNLYFQFPKIFIFNEEYSLNQSLPNKIVPEWADDNNPFQARFINFLGEEKVDRFLIADDPEEREKLLKQLSSKLKILIKKVNENRSIDEKADLLEMRLDASTEGIQITVKTDGKKSFYSHLSDNTKFLFAYHLYLETDNINQNILLFDEPNNGFHPTAQRKMLRFLQRLGEKGNQVIVSTHSEYLIDPDYLSGVRLMSSDKDKNTIVRPHFYNQTKNKGDFLALQPIFDAIGFKYGNQLEIKENVIITEGVTELLYLRSFNRIFNLKLDLNIAPARGEGQIPHIISFLISQGLSFKILIDTGNIRSHIKKDFSIEDKYVYEVPIPTVFKGRMKGSGIEDLFSKDDFKNLLKKVGHTVTRQ
ncbi:MAG: ATP-binding protein, partial [Acidobacteria bacterium]|nr:ATP-binding protein [Acidobacteriota bacterium]